MSLLNRNAYQTDVDLADHFTGSPSPTFWSKWFGGVVVPTLLALYAVRLIVTQQAVLHGQHRSGIELTGHLAVIFGLVWLSSSLFLHFHYFWSSLRRLWVFADLGKVISLLGFIGALGYLLWAIMMG